MLNFLGIASNSRIGITKRIPPPGFQEKVFYYEACRYWYDFQIILTNAQSKHDKSEIMHCRKLIVYLSISFT